MVGWEFGADALFGGQVESEELLVKCGKFRLPSQRQLYQPGWEWKVVVVDVGEMEIERPPKNTNLL